TVFAAPSRWCRVGLASSCGTGSPSLCCFFFSSRRRHTRSKRDWSSDVCSSDLYRVVPRDRDQVIRLMDGFFPYLVAREWAIPANQGFSPEIERVNYSLFKSDFLNAHPKMQFSYEEWMDLSREFVSRVSDTVLVAALRRLPESSYDLRGEQLLADLKQRRDLIPEKMDEHFRFVNSIVDIRLSNKHE